MSLLPWFVLLAALAVLFVAWPLLRRKDDDHAATVPDAQQRIAVNNALHAEQLEELAAQLAEGEISEGQYQKLKAEADALRAQDNAIDQDNSVKRSFSRPTWLVAIIALAVPLIAVGLYVRWGAAEDLRIQQLSTELLRLQARGAELADVQDTAAALYEKLEDRLAAQPDNLNNRFLLARTAVELGDFRAALDAYRYILEQQPNSPQVVSELAQVLYMAAGNRFTPEVQQVFDQALMMDPQNTDLLGFAGIGAFQSGQFQLAIDYWQKGMKHLQPGDPRQATWQQAIDQARQQVAASGDAEVQEDTSVQEEGAATAALRVSVRLGDEVSAKPGDTVFIYARAWQGPRLPLAMQQVTVADLPLTVELDDSMSMMPGMTISRFPELEVVARISSSGLAEARSGDWQASAGPVDSSDSSPAALELVIEEQLQLP